MVFLVRPVFQFQTRDPLKLSCIVRYQNGGEGGIDSLRSPCGQSVRERPACPDGAAVCRTPTGVLITPLCTGYMQKKCPAVNRALL